jgi:hypothetical protein
MPSKYTYRFLKSSWGIYVGLTAELKTQADFEGVSLNITPGISLSIEVPHLLADEQEFLALAIKLAKHKLEERFEQQLPIVIHVLGLEIVLTDYGPQGLTYALVGWMEQELGIRVGLPQPIFDKESKRYIFPALINGTD